MPDSRSELLLELFSEEIPARMQAKAAADLEGLMSKGLREAGVGFESAQAFVTPRRLVLHVAGLALQTEAVREELKGPRTDAPEKALEGFLRKTGLSKDQLEIRDDKKGQVYFAVVETPGRASADVVAELVPQVVRGFPWPKSMRWGSGDLRWVRPLRSVLCVIGAPGVAEVVPFDIDGIQSGNRAWGHRVMAPKAVREAGFEVSGFEDYKQRLRAAKVMLDAGERGKKIERDAKKLAREAGLELVADPGLLREVTGLVEWPVALMGEIELRFQALPPEVLQTSMKEHQKFFSLRDPASGKITRFITVANIASKDKGAKIVAGNERVLRARLSDAEFFYNNDLQAGLEAGLPKLEAVTFHNKLGSQAARINRIRDLARLLAPMVGADPALADRAAALAKADLVTEMVFEFPELQGLMGRYYAQAAGEDAAVAAAIEAHYAPLGPSDAVPNAPVSIAVSLADKIDTLTGFWAIDEKPTGSKDPFALRRAALGVIRILLENSIRLPLEAQFEAGLAKHPGEGKLEDVAADLMRFTADRLKVYLRESGVRHDVIDAVFALGGQDDLTDVVARVRALQKLLGTEDGANLLAAFKRANNILTAEEKKDGVEYSLAPDVKFAEEPAEKALFAALDAADKAVGAALRKENYPQAMSAMAKLRGPLDTFFEAVVVNADSPVLRRNRLCLLHRIRESFGKVADFASVEG
ncbi:MAG: glycine--tRNA ligase subunit beta [Neomegalonema sp.]|nr:glycine--tRNA ligase subunit beta [Neomegalonema sp.]